MSRVCLSPRPGVVLVCSLPRQESQGQDRGPFLAEGATWVQTPRPEWGSASKVLGEKPLLARHWARPLDNLSSSFLISKSEGVSGGPLTVEGRQELPAGGPVPGSQIRLKLWPGSCLCNFSGRGWRGSALGEDSWTVLPGGDGFSVAVHKGAPVHSEADAQRELQLTCHLTWWGRFLGDLPRGQALA